MNHGYHVTTIAGNGTKGFRNGNAQDAMFGKPYGICPSKDGKLYVSDHFNNRIRVIYNGQVATIAGNGQHGFQDGNAQDAMFSGPKGVCHTEDGRIYVSDTLNDRIRLIYHGQVTTIAGNGKHGFQDGNALEAMFCTPTAICCSIDGKLYVADRNNNRIRMIYDGQVTTIAGNGKEGFQDGNALEAMFRIPTGICCTTDGILYISDTYNNRIRMIYNGKVSTIAGIGLYGFQDGNALEAMFRIPTGICCTTDGILYISDTYNNRIRMIYNGKVSTIAGIGQFGLQDGNALKSMFKGPMGICHSTDGKSYVSDNCNHVIRMISNSQMTRMAVNQDDPKSLFGFALLHGMQTRFCDYQISFKNNTYYLHSVLMNVRCPLLLDQLYFSLIEKSNISSESFEAFVNFLYLNKLTKQDNQVLPTTMSIKNILELIFIFDLLMNCKWILIDLKTNFRNQLIQITETEQSMTNLIIDVLPFIYNLKELIKTRHLTSNIKTNTSYTKYCYDTLVDELHKRRLIVAQHIPDLQSHLTYDTFASILEDLMSATSEIETPDDESMIVHGCGLAELSELAFYNTNISKSMDKNEIKLESKSISTKHLDQWKRPDFVIKLSNHDEIEYHVHKSILSGRWKYFCLMIESGLKEVSENQMTLSEDWNKSRFEKMMKYIYLNQIEFDDLKDIAWLMKNRKLYGITINRPDAQDNSYKIRLDQSKRNEEDEIAAYGFEQLYEYCLGILRQPLTLSNCISLYSTFEEIGEESAIQEASNFITTNLLILMRNKTSRNEMRRIIEQEKMMDLFWTHFENEDKT